MCVIDYIYLFLVWFLWFLFIILELSQIVYLFFNETILDIKMMGKKCPKTGNHPNACQQVNELIYYYFCILWLLLRNKQEWICDTICMNLKNIVLSDRNRTQKEPPLYDPIYLKL